MKLTDKTKVSVVTAACLVGLVVVLKNVLNVPYDPTNIVLWIIIYGGFFVVLNFTDGEKPREAGTPLKVSDSPWFWSALVVGITLAIIALYAFW